MMSLKSPSRQNWLIAASSVALALHRRGNEVLRTEIFQARIAEKTTGMPSSCSSPDLRPPSARRRPRSFAGVSAPQPTPPLQIGADFQAVARTAVCHATGHLTAPLWCPGRAGGVRRRGATEHLAAPPGFLVCPRTTAAGGSQSAPRLCGRAFVPSWHAAVSPNKEARPVGEEVRGGSRGAASIAATRP